MDNGGAALKDVIEKVVKTIVSTADPIRIVLFGSAARGEMSRDSDLDLLVVVPAGQHRRKTAQVLYRKLVDLGFAVDIVVVTEDDIERFADNPGMIIGAALKEGVDLYAA